MIGFDIGGTKCAVSVGEEGPSGLRILYKETLATHRYPDPYDMLLHMCEIAESRTEDLSCIGISCGGPLDSGRGIIQSPPNLPNWKNVAAVDFLKRRYHGAAGLQNDADACALAEWKYGAGKGTRNMIFLTFGTGMGAGLILNGQLYSGTSDMAGEIGHIRLERFGPVGYGKSGSVEGFCSGGGIAQIARAMAMERFQAGQPVSFCHDPSALSEIDAKCVAIAADAGDADAKEVYKICGTQLGRAVSILIDLLNPEKIVIGSIYQRSEALLREHVLRAVAEETLPRAREICQIVPALLGENLGDYAALSVAASL